MKITVMLTPIMNMLIKTTFEVDDQSTLEKVKDLVFTKYQQTLQNHAGPFIQVHGKPEDLVLRGRGVVIDSEDKLDSIQVATINFEAYFPCGQDKSIDPHSRALEKFNSEF